MKAGGGLFSAAHGLPALWLIVFLVCVLGFSSASPPHALLLAALGVAGLVVAWRFHQGTLARLWKQFGWIWLVYILVGCGIFSAELMARPVGAAGFWRLLGPQAGLVTCLPALSVFLTLPRVPLAVGTVLCALCLWHFFAVPLEAVSGLRIGWLNYEVVVREFGWLKYQSAGLSSHPYLFAGFYLPAFYLAWGWAHQTWSPSNQWVASRSMAWLPWLWLLPAACLQSRSAFMGALIASSLCTVGVWRQAGPARQLAHRDDASKAQPIGAFGLVNRRFWLIALTLFLLILALSAWFLTLQNKTGLDLRSAYWQLYWSEAMRWPDVLIGHGFLNDRHHLAVPGLPYIWHSHNDLLEILYSWGAITLVPYLMFAAALVQLLFRAWQRDVVWLPAAALCVLPTMVTDLGFHHYEKAVLFTLLAAWCIAQESAINTTARTESRICAK